MVPPPLVKVLLRGVLLEAFCVTPGIDAGATRCDRYLKTVEAVATGVCPRVGLVLGRDDLIVDRNVFVVIFDVIFRELQAVQVKNSFLVFHGSGSKESFLRKPSGKGKALA